MKSLVRRLLDLFEGRVQSSLIKLLLLVTLVICYAHAISNHSISLAHHPSLGATLHGLSFSYPANACKWDFF